VTRRHEAGFTLVEVLVAATVLVVGLLALLQMTDTAGLSTTSFRARDGATSLARQVTEAARSIPYSSLTPQTIEDELQDQPGLGPQGGDGGWRVTRRGVAYELTASLCDVDDPADGRGPHDSGAFCAGVGDSGTTDDNPDDYKRVTVDVTWSTAGRERSLRQVAVINNPGNAGGPSVAKLEISPPAGTLVTTDLVHVGLTATTSQPAAAVSFLVDGVPAGPATGTTSSWTFAWSISGLVDGTHLVTAQAFDSEGLSGAPRSVTITLNRFLPAAPKGVVGGRNESVVDLEWLPNKELDVAGYRVFRGLPGVNPTLVCPLTRESACQDTSPPAGELTYYVVADDLDTSGDYRDGLPSAPITVLETATPPGAPTGLTATRTDGTTTLRWTAPSDGSVAFYRIYRDQLAYSARYDRTGSGNDLSYADGRTDGSQHQYWVTAVNSQLAESPAAGPVTG